MEKKVYLIWQTSQVSRDIYELCDSLDLAYRCICLARKADPRFGYTIQVLRVLSDQISD